MKLIGMLDSPYVRRVAISLQVLDLPFEHAPLSVFRHFDEIRAINPLVKVPTLVCDDGTVLMDSGLILEWAESQAHPRTLMPVDPQPRQRALRLLGLAMACCEKAVAVVYETRLRPEQAQHQPWLVRLQTQLRGGFDALEAELMRHPLRSDGAPLSSASLCQASITCAVAWQFVQGMLPGVMSPNDFPALAALSAQAEALPEFKAAAYGEGRYPVQG